MYSPQLWFNSTKGSLKKLKTSHNSALRRFLVISKPYSASQMLVSRGILSFDELLRKSLTGSLREVKTVQTQLYMPAYHHLFSYTLPFENGGAHYYYYYYYISLFTQNMT